MKLSTMQHVAFAVVLLLVTGVTHALVIHSTLCADASGALRVDGVAGINTPTTTIAAPITLPILINDTLQDCQMLFTNLNLSVGSGIVVTANMLNVSIVLGDGVQIENTSVSTVGSSTSQRSVVFIGPSQEAAHSSSVVVEDFRLAVAVRTLELVGFSSSIPADDAHWLWRAECGNSSSLTLINVAFVIQHSNSVAVGSGWQLVSLFNTSVAGATVKVVSVPEDFTALSALPLVCIDGSEHDIANVSVIFDNVALSAALSTPVIDLRAHRAHDVFVTVSHCRFDALQPSGGVNGIVSPSPLIAARMRLSVSHVLLSVRNTTIVGTNLSWSPFVLLASPNATDASIMVVDVLTLGAPTDFAGSWVRCHARSHWHRTRVSISAIRGELQRMGVLRQPLVALSGIEESTSVVTGALEDAEVTVVGLVAEVAGGSATVVDISQLERATDILVMLRNVSWTATSLGSLSSVVRIHNCTGNASRVTAAIIGSNLTLSSSSASVADAVVSLHALWSVWDAVVSVETTNVVGCVSDVILLSNSSAVVRLQVLVLSCVVRLSSYNVVAAPSLLNLAAPGDVVQPYVTISNTKVHLSSAPLAGVRLIGATVHNGVVWLLHSSWYFHSNSSTTSVAAVGALVAVIASAVVDSDIKLTNALVENTTSSVVVHVAQDSGIQGCRILVDSAAVLFAAVGYAMIYFESSALTNVTVEWQHSTILYAEVDLCVDAVIVGIKNASRAAGVRTRVVGNGTSRGGIGTIHVLLADTNITDLSCEFDGGARDAIFNQPPRCVSVSPFRVVPHSTRRYVCVESDTPSSAVVQSLSVVVENASIAPGVSLVPVLPARSCESGCSVELRNSSVALDPNVSLILIQIALEQRAATVLVHLSNVAVVPSSDARRNFSTSAASLLNVVMSIHGVVGSLIVTVFELDVTALNTSVLNALADCDTVDVRLAGVFLAAETSWGAVDTDGTVSKAASLLNISAARNATFVEVTSVTATLTDAAVCMLTLWVTEHSSVHLAVRDVAVVGQLLSSAGARIEAAVVSVLHAAGSYGAIGRGSVISLVNATLSLGMSSDAMQLSLARRAPSVLRIDCDMIGASVFGDRVTVTDLDAADGMPTLPMTSSQDGNGQPIVYLTTSRSPSALQLVDCNFTFVRTQIRRAPMWSSVISVSDSLRSALIAVLHVHTIHNVTIDLLGTSCTGPAAASLLSLMDVANITASAFAIADVVSTSALSHGASFVYIAGLLGNATGVSSVAVQMSHVRVNNATQHDNAMTLRHAWIADSVFTVEDVTVLDPFLDAQKPPYIEDAWFLMDSVVLTSSTILWAANSINSTRLCNWVAFHAALTTMRNVFLDVTGAKPGAWDLSAVTLGVGGFMQQLIFSNLTELDNVTLHVTNIFPSLIQVVDQRTGFPAVCVFHNGPIVNVSSALIVLSNMHVRFVNCSATDHFIRMVAAVMDRILVEVWNGVYASEVGNSALQFVASTRISNSYVGIRGGNISIISTAGLRIQTPTAVNFTAEFIGLLLVDTRDGSSPCIQFSPPPSGEPITIDALKMHWAMLTTASPDAQAIGLLDVRQAVVRGADISFEDQGIGVGNNPVLAFGNTSGLRVRVTRCGLVSSCATYPYCAPQAFVLLSGSVANCTVVMDDARFLLLGRPITVAQFKGGGEGDVQYTLRSIEIVVSNTAFSVVNTPAVAWPPSDMLFGLVLDVEALEFSLVENISLSLTSATAATDTPYLIALFTTGRVRGLTSSRSPLWANVVCLVSACTLQDVVLFNDTSQAVVLIGVNNISLSSSSRLVALQGGQQALPCLWCGSRAGIASTVHVAAVDSVVSSMMFVDFIDISHSTEFLQRIVRCSWAGTVQRSNATRNTSSTAVCSIVLASSTLQALHAGSGAAECTAASADCAPISILSPFGLLTLVIQDATFVDYRSILSPATVTLHALRPVLATMQGCSFWVRSGRSPRVVRLSDFGTSRTINNRPLPPPQLTIFVAMCDAFFDDSRSHSGSLSKSASGLITMSGVYTSSAALTTPTLPWGSNTSLPTQSLSLAGSARQTVLVPARKAPRVGQSVGATLGVFLQGAVVGPAGGLWMQRTVLQSSLAACEYDISDPVDIATSPTRMQLGAALGAHIRGAVVGNVALFVGFAVCSAVVVIARMRLDAAKRRPGRNDTHKAILHAAAELSLPSWLAVPYGLLMQPTISAATALLVHRPSGASDAAIAIIVGYVVCLTPLLSVAFVLLFRFRAKQVRVVDSGRALARAQAIISQSPVVLHTPLLWVARVGVWLTHREFEWVDDADGASSRFADRYSVLFDGYHQRREWYGLVEFGVSVVCGVLGGVMPNDVAVCRGLVVALCCVNIASLLAFLALRPLMMKCEIALAVINYSCTAVWGPLALLGHSSVAEAMSQTQLWLQLILIGVVALRVFLTGQARDVLRRLGAASVRLLKPVHKSEGIGLQSIQQCTNRAHKSAFTKPEIPELPGYPNAQQGDRKLLVFSPARRHKADTDKNVSGRMTRQHDAILRQLVTIGQHPRTSNTGGFQQQRHALTALVTLIASQRRCLVIRKSAAVADE